MIIVVEATVLIVYSLSTSGPTKTLFVKGLSEDTTDQTLKEAFENAVAARIVTDRDTGSSKGYVCPVVIPSRPLALLVNTALSTCDSKRIHIRSRATSQLNRQLPWWKLPMSDVKQNNIFNGYINGINFAVWQ